MDPTATTPATEPDLPSPQEELARRQDDEKGAPAEGRGLLRFLAEHRSPRDEELRKAIDFQGDGEAWKQLLWRLHNEGYVKVRWVGLADPDPVEARITERGLAAIAAPGDAGQRRPPIPP